MTQTNPYALTLPQIRARLDALYPQTQQPGCPRDVMLEYQELDDEFEARTRDERVVICSHHEDYDDTEMDIDQPGPEWGA